MKVANILEHKGRDVLSVPDTSNMSDAVELLGNKNIGAIVVTNAGGGVSGILSERDVVRHIASSGAGVLEQPISDFMTRNVVTCTPESTTDEMMTLMTKRRIRHLPVVENDSLAGIISIGDVVKRKIEETELEAETLKQYIATG